MALNFGLLLWIIFSASFALGLGNNHFVNPPDLSSQTASLTSYPIYAVGDILAVSWVTTADVVDLVINQLNSPATQIDRTPNSAALSTGTYTWKITTDGSDGGAKFDLTFSNVFNFMAFKVNSTTITAQSAYFNISNTTVNQHGQRIADLTPTSTTRLPTSLTSSTSSMSSSLSSVHSALSTSSILASSGLSSSSTLLPETSASPTSASTVKGLSMAANVGLGIGVGIAGVAAIAGVIIWFLFHRRKLNAQQTPFPPYDDPQYTETSFKGGDAHSNWSPPSELPVPAARKVYPSEMPLTAPQKDLPTELPS